eukprot:2463894-Prymnesium_polylepis.2
MWCRSRCSLRTSTVGSASRSALRRTYAAARWRASSMNARWPWSMSAPTKSHRSRIMGGVCDAARGGGGRCSARRRSMRRRRRARARRPPPSDPRRGTGRPRKSAAGEPCRLAPVGEPGRAARSGEVRASRGVAWVRVPSVESWLRKAAVLPCRAVLLAGSRRWRTPAGGIMSSTPALSIESRSADATRCSLPAPASALGPAAGRARATREGSARDHSRPTAGASARTGSTSTCHGARTGTAWPPEGAVRLT